MKVKLGGKLANCAVLLFTLLWVGIVSSNPVLTKIQSPDLDAQKNYAKGRIEFVGYIKDERQRVPGITVEDLKVVKQRRFRVRVLNERSLYDDSIVTDEYTLLMIERYCNRYNKIMLSLAKDNKKFYPPKKK